MPGNRKDGGRSRAGQAMVEYAIVFALLVAVVAALWHFVHSARKASHRTAVLMSSENS